jgi:hypothetical protein
MQTDTRVTSTEHRTGGLWTHTGQLILHFQMEDGTIVTVTLPDDLVALQKPTLEDMTYGH